jgi:hypothetical protein
MPLLTPLMCTVCVRPLSRETCYAGEFLWELDTIAEPRRLAPATSSNPQLASARWSAPLQPSPLRSTFEPSRRRPRRRRASSYLIIPYLSSILAYALDT